MKSLITSFLDARSDTEVNPYILTWYLRFIVKKYLNKTFLPFPASPLSGNPAPEAVSLVQDSNMEAEEGEEAEPVTNALLVDHGLFRFESRNENIFYLEKKN